ncbi:MAG: CotH kinase family protein [Lachnospiraceae bacterium]|nr:CotH kinase family protein [Lachnospiraceae bacterium]
MSSNKKIDKICVAVVAFTVILALIFCNGKAFGIETQARTIGYENRLFDNTKVHTFDIVIDDWDSFISTCESELYTNCNVVIDGELIKNVGIRGKGNTSLSSVKSMGSSRYSFKIEFDQYDKTKSYHGLDKLCLNNIIQDNTYMKDYLAYTLMSEFGVDAPLCSFVYITVNGEDWGLYLAVEAIEESFLERNYGSNYGDLYKPDSLSFGGGGPGNGKDFSMTDFLNENSGDEDSDISNIPDMGSFPGFGGSDGTNSSEDGSEKSDSRQGFGGFGGGGFGGGGFGGFGMGSDDVKLKYIDDDPDSYSNIFGNAKTTVNQADQNRLISALKNLTEQTDIENTVDVEEVIRYFVVHNFLCNGDSYTGSMIHNYYLYEKDGQLSMIPWDYNLAYGSFQGGNASSSVNAAIDTPVSGGMSDRPMISWIFDIEEYTELYHEYFREFLNNVNLTEMIEDTAALIDEYVEKDPTKFCTYEEFLTGVEAIKSFCELRAESVQGQLDGTIPSTSSGQSTDSSALIDTGALNTSDMGSMGGNRGGFGGGNRSSSSDDETSASAGSFGFGGGNMPEGFDPSQFGGGNMPEGFDPSQFGGGNMPEGFDPSQFGGGNMPEGFDPSQFGGGNMPGGFDSSQFGGGNMPEGFDSSQFGGSGKKDSAQSESNDTENTDKADTQTEQSDTEQKNTESSGKPSSSKTGSSGRSSSDRSSFNGSSFPGMGSTGQSSDSTPYILLGVSALVLAAGVVFAALFKKKK